jgi:hypothetical protein
MADFSDKLSEFLRRRIESCHDKPAGPEATRLKTIDDLLAELETTGIQVDGFTTVKTTVKEQSASGIVYIITSNALPADECFITISDGEAYGQRRLFFRAQLYEASTYDRYVDNAHFGFIFRFLERFVKTAKEFPAHRARYAKREKINEFTRNSIDTWLEQICGELTLPYTLEKGRLRSVLTVLLDDETQLALEIRNKAFQETIPEVLETIQMYEHLHKTRKGRVLITNSTYRHWKENKKKPQPERGV